MNDASQQALEQLYQAFSTVAKPRTIEGCRCCIDDREVHTLLTKPLREISGEEMASYASSALLTVGHPADYRYYLPRILEIHGSQPCWWPDIEVIGRAMHAAGWLQWSNPERAALENFFFSRTAELVAAGEAWTLDGFVCGAIRARIPASPLLARIASSHEMVLGYYAQNAAELARGSLGNAFWEDDPVGAKIVLDWFFSPEIRAVILDGVGVDLGTILRV